MNKRHDDTDLAGQISETIIKVVAIAGYLFCVGAGVYLIKWG